VRKSRQVEALCCGEPEACNKTKAFLKPYDAVFFLKDDLILLQ
jgi:hypothetical protein